MFVTSHHVEPDAVVVLTDTGRMKIQVLGPEIIRVVQTRQDRFGTAESLMILPAPAAAPQVAEVDGGLLVSTSALRLRIDALNGAFTWTDSSGRLLVREPHDGAPTRTLEEVLVHRPLRAADARITNVSGADGPKAVTEAVPRIVDRTAYSTTLRLELAEGEAIYGLGQHEEGILNYRGHQQYLYQQNLKVAAPVIVSTAGYGMLWDSCAFASFTDDRDGTRFWTETDDELDYYFILGPEIDAIVGRIRTLTGQVPPLPRWALGYFQSKEHYASQEELVEIAREHRRRDIPLDCVVQDWKSWTGELWGQKSFDPIRYPDPSRLCADLHALNTRLMVSVWPTMHNDGPDQVEMRERGHLLGNDATYDAFSADARRLYWKQADEGYFRFGVDAWWTDCTEPFEADWNGTVKPDAATRARINTDESKKYLDAEHLNAYALLHTRGLYEGQRGADPHRRPVVLTRSGSPGQQRYGAVTWSGDVTATWATLRAQIADGLNFCMTGNPRWSCDIGGFFVDRKEPWFWRGDFPAGCADLGYRELYVRWLQFGAFLPMFRSHGTDTPREPWRFGDVGDSTYETILAFIRLRYRLLPYLYTLQGWEAHRGYTGMRALAFDFRGDPAVYDIDDQLMIGPALMICPVTEPMYFGPGSTPITDTVWTRQVYLPTGCDWYDFWTGERHTGGRTIHAAAPLEHIPVFVRAGSVLPLGPVMSHADEMPDAPLEVRVYPGSDGRFDLYDDAGDGFGYEEGEFTFTSLRWSDAEGRFLVQASTGAGGGTPAHRDFRPVVVGTRGGLGSSELTTDDSTVHYRGQPVSRLIK
ncbi:glycoside hydrolase [Streptomyces sp. P3]|uniref:glycoside hydrolase family 31 protein n=1 Tax=Streptomyces sp. P3 TaxID=2135430 RepID=UPI000D199A1F|nr:TIM-barrel domain-containing protein [Streptomyces sp. P3]AVV45184.1 glycoside hydrolase [Streptomyces sp. P3]